VFVVQKETSTSKRKKRSSVQLPPECDLDPDCYITAEIDSSLVDSGGYDFRVGDGKTYQDYYNAPLEPNQGYKIYQAVTVQNEVLFDTKCYCFSLSIYFYTHINKHCYNFNAYIM